MAWIVTFKTPSGDEMVIVRAVDHHSMVEASDMTADGAAIRRFEEKSVAGEEEFIPAEYVYRMLDGESRVAVWREFRGMTVKELATAAGISLPDRNRQA